MAVDPEKVYRGSPCRKAGHTLRWKDTGGCVACQRWNNRISQARYRAKNHEKLREINRISQRHRYERQKAKGLCTKCGKPSLSEAYCWDCLSRKQDAQMLGGS